jgi:hypothetical protein
MTTDMTKDQDVAGLEAAARSLLATAGLSPSEQEVADLVAQYPMHVAGLKALWAMPEARYAAPALIFDPTPVFADWS